MLLVISCFNFINQIHWPFVIQSNTFATCSNKICAGVNVLLIYVHLVFPPDFVEKSSTKVLNTITEGGYIVHLNGLRWNLRRLKKAKTHFSAKKKQIY